MSPFFALPSRSGGRPLTRTGWRRRADRLRASSTRRPLVLESLESRTLLTGTFTPLAHTSLDASGTMMLEANGTVIVQGGGVSKAWDLLAPDSSGSYVNGTWTRLAAMSTQRLYFGSNVLTDGRILVQGGEYSGPLGLANWVNTGEIYTPSTNSWTNIATFPNSQFGDDPTEVLPNGTVLAGYLSGPQTYIYNPTSNTWSQAGTKLLNDRSDEEAWVKLADGSILSYDVFNTAHAQRYIPSTNTWVDAGTVPVPLSSGAVGEELGPGFLLPDGRAFYLGANGNTAYYTPSTNSWTAGPVIPGGLGADDAAGAMLPDGKILFTADTPLFNSPAHIFEFDPTTNIYSDISASLPSSFLNTPSYVDRMLMLPSGQVLIGNGGSQLYVYTPDLAPLPAGVPTISNISENADGSFLLTGTLLNGISEGAAYGDDAEMSSNYPIVRLTDPSGNVFFARTYNWSSTGVATGATPETTDFALPVGLPANTYSVSVIANGFASSAFSLTIPTNTTDPAPTFAIAASATPNPVTGTTTSLSALGADVLGESTLTYNWTATTVPAGAPFPSFSTNGTNAAKNDTVTFYRAGTYVFQVTATNLAELSATSSVTVVVNQTFSSVTVTSTPVNVNPSATRQFTATGLDQFGQSLASQPTFSWSVTAGNGSVSATGLYTAPPSGTLATVTATSGAISNSAAVYVLSHPWSTQDIGGPALSGAAGDDSNGTYTLLASGADIYGASDEFRYAYQTLTGDGAIIARVASEQNTDGFAKAGVMFRNGLTASAFEAMMAVTPGNGATFQYRNSSFPNSNSVTKGGPSAPYWVKLVRSGNTFTGYDSPDGVTWTLVGSAVISMGTTIDVGLALTSHSAGVRNTSTFDHVIVDTTPSVATAASATPNPVTGTTTNLSVLGADNLGEATLTYTWATTALPVGATTPTFSANGTNAAKNDTATFFQAGSYTFTVTITNPAGLTITSSVNVTVNATPTVIMIAPTAVTLAQGATQQFTATIDDQFGAALASQPTYTWSVTTGGAGGSVSTTGLYTAPATGFGIDDVVASADGLTATAVVTITQAPIVTLSPVNQTVTTGQPVTFTAAATGYPTPTVQWFVSSDGINFTAVTGATNPTLTFTSQLSQNGNFYEAVFTNSLGTATTSAAMLTVSQVQVGVSAVSVAWGTAGTAPLFTAADGLRLLPAGRNTDLPWMGINSIAITLSAPATLAAGDVSVTGITVANYGPVTVSGSGTNYVLTFAQPINAADRVTVSIGNATIGTFTRRLDVLPGDVNDDGVVNVQDLVIVRDGYTGFGDPSLLPPIIFLDVNGDGVVSVADLNVVRSKVGTQLPPLG